MKIEKINDDKIRITLSMDDLKENDIDFKSFISDPIESQDAFLNVLEKAEEEIGFNTDNYRVMVEALAMSNGTFVLTVTRINKEKVKNTYNKSHRLSTKRKVSSINSKKAIYCFNTFDDFVEYCTFINNDYISNIENFSTCSKLYLYNDKYYLVIDNIILNINLLKSFTASITEFARFVDDSTLFESKLLEYGKLIFKKEAITRLHISFCKKIESHADFLFLFLI